MPNINHAKEEALISENKGLVLFLCESFRQNGVLDEDYIQAGTIGLLRAIRKYDETRGTKLSTFAYQAILRELYIVKKQKKPLPLIAKADYIEPDSLFEWLPIMSSLEKQIIEYKYASYTNKEIAILTNLEDKQIKALLQKIRQKIKNANKD